MAQQDGSVRFATTVASGHATLATKRTLPLTWTGLSPAGSHQLAAGAPIRSLSSARALTSGTAPVIASGNFLRDPNWLLGGGFCRSRCWLGYHNRIGNCLRNIDGFRAGLMSTNHARPP